jgi:3-oxoacyl-[acyl-carrier-protein] synthase-1
MMTAVGLSAAETAAAVRAGTARFTETPLRDKRFAPFTVAEVLDDGLPPLSPELAAGAALTNRERRMLRLATSPLRECVAALGARSARVGLCLALPEVETGLPLARATFVERLAVQARGTFDPRASDGSHVGRSGGFIAVGQAVLTIQESRSDFVIAGGVDSYRDPYVLGTLDQEERVKSETNWDGFIPGEGAGFLLLAGARAAAAAGLTPLASVSSVAGGFEEGHLYSEQPYRGAGLAETIQRLVASDGFAAPFGEVYSSMNGESHWAKEWGVSFLRTRFAFHEGHGMHHPADSFGDTGAASGPLMVGLAALGIKGRYRRSPVLAYGASDRGGRAAIMVGA